jgi:transcriptional regulator with XRE-family HTH domain
MREVDARKHRNASARYMRALVAHTGLTQNQAAERIGVSARMMRYYLSDEVRGKPAPYHVQAALEALANWSEQERSEA